jgi:D-2-hydroxyacid dehydrogenase (NADP+)
MAQGVARRIRLRATRARKVLSETEKNQLNNSLAGFEQRSPHTLLGISLCPHRRYTAGLSVLAFAGHYRSAEAGSMNYVAKALSLALTSMMLVPVVGTVPASAQSASPDAVDLIETLSLRESKEPIRSHPRWARPEKIAVGYRSSTGGSSDAYLVALQAVAGDAELVLFDPFDADLSRISDADVLISFCRSSFLHNFPNLRWFHSYSVGVERCVRVPERPDLDFIMTNNQRVSAPSIAELAIGMALMFSKNFPLYMRQQNERHWDRRHTPLASDLAGKTMLVLGLGGIGTETARRAHALGMRIVATRSSSRDGPDFVDRVGLSEEMYDLAREADIVVNALPWTQRTDGLVDRRFFDAVKRGAYYINVGRGRTTVTADLIAALDDGRLGGAGVDVIDPEPLPADHPFWDADNVILTPHVSGRSRDAFRRSMIVATENLRRYVLGDRMFSIVDRERGY